MYQDVVGASKRLHKVKHIIETTTTPSVTSEYIVAKASINSKPYLVVPQRPIVIARKFSRFIFPGLAGNVFRFLLCAHARIKPRISWEKTIKDIISNTKKN